MFVSTSTVPFRLNVTAETRGVPESLRRTWLVALGWVGASLGFAVLTMVVYGFVIGLHNAGVGRLGPKWPVDQKLAVLICGTGLQAMLLWAAWQRARVVGGGDRRAGFGWTALQRPGLFTVLAVITALTPLAWTALLVQVVHPGPSLALTQGLRTGSGGWLMPTGTALLILVLAPVAEELFFRGWLWTSLRRHWSVSETAVATAVPWLLLHLGDGLYRPLFLIPAAVLFSVARARCGGVRASLFVHLLNNLVAVGFLAVSRL